VPPTGGSFSLHRTSSGSTAVGSAPTATSCAPVIETAGPALRWGR